MFLLSSRQNVNYNANSLELHTEILWWIFWRNKWRTFFDIVRDSSFCYFFYHQTYAFCKIPKATLILGRNFNFRTFNCEFWINTWHLITFDCLRLLHLQCLLYAAAELMQGSKTKLYLFQLQTFAICTFCVIGNCWKLRGLSAILIQKAFWSKESHSVAWEAGYLNTKCMI